MSLAIVYSRAQIGIDAPLVSVEAHLSNGLPSFNIVGLPETAVKESKERVRSALINSHFEFPARRITLNLAPADLPKDGGRFDLPIALAILAASEQLPQTYLDRYEFIGELALSGHLRGVGAALPAAIAASQAQRTLMVAPDNAAEAALATDGIGLSAVHLLEVCAFLREPANDLRKHFSIPIGETYSADMRDIRGQPIARRALEIAAAGGHNLLLFGPPGSGKTMLAQRLPSILPPLERAAAMEVAQIHSVAGRWQPQTWSQRPYRQPHHTASAAAMVGGGSNPVPGEISLAHCGILFLDEFPEFSRQVLEVLREPLESGHIAIARARHKISYPARFQLVAAMNPCPCGYLTDPTRNCRCSPNQIQHYRSKLSGPLLDRIDMHLDVQPVSSDDIFSRRQEESSELIRDRVIGAIKKQTARGTANNLLNGDHLYRDCQLNEAELKRIASWFKQLQLSARSMTRVLRVARTIADLAGVNKVEQSHIAEAMSYRNFDRLG